MKRFCYILAIIIWGTAMLSAQPKQELRAVWLTNVDSYVLNSDKGIADAMDYLAGIGVNVVFPVVWNKGFTLYPSSIMDSLFGVPILKDFSGRDPLKRVIIEAHRNGIEVIPWWEYGFACSYSLNGGHVIAKFPDWACKDQTGNLVVKNGFDWMNGLNPGVQNFMKSLIMELVNNYEVDGIQGDDRLPAMPAEGGYDSLTVATYKAEMNGATPPANYADVNWQNWRAGKLNIFFRQLRNSIKAVDTNLIVSSAPSVYPWGLNNYLQDSKTWVDSGIVDNFIPQIYRQDMASYSTELYYSLSYTTASKRNIFFPGILAKSGSYVIPDSLLINSMKLDRQYKINGESFFFYEALRANNNKLGDTLKSLFYTDAAIPPYRNGNTWRPKALVVNEDDAGAVLTGNWTKLGAMGFKPNIYYSDDTVGYSSIAYKFSVPETAWYGLYAYIVPNILFSSNANYTYYSGGDSVNVIINQQDSKNSGWVKVADVYLQKGERTAIKLDNKNLQPGKKLLADAMMLMVNRKLSPNAVITSVKNENGKSAEIKSFRLEQNYPNPFNPSTKINFRIAKASFVTLKVYDVLGREVTTLINGYKQPGNYTVDFNMQKTVTGFSSGVYFYRLNAEGLCETKKMLLLK